MPDNSSPLWSILKLTVMGCLLVALLHFNYTGLDIRDATTIIIMLAGGGIGEFLTNRTKKKDE